MSNPNPFSAREIEVLREIRDELLRLDDVHGGWETKIDARQTGFSLHVKFDKRVDVQTAIRVATIFDQGSIKLCQIISRVLDQLEVDDSGLT